MRAATGVHLHARSVEGILLTANDIKCFVPLRHKAQLLKGERMAAFKKFGGLRASSGCLRHILREVKRPTNIDIDPDRTKLNYDLAPQRRMKPYEEHPPEQSDYRKSYGKRDQYLTYLFAFFHIHLRKQKKRNAERLFLSVPMTCFMFPPALIFPAGFSDIFLPWIPRHKQGWQTHQTHFRFPCWSAPWSFESLPRFP